MPKLILDYRHARKQTTAEPSPLTAFLSQRWIPWAFLLAIILAGVALWLISMLTVQEAHSASPRAVAEFTTILPPTQATHIMVSSANGGCAPGFSHFVRFEAPPDVCLQYASAVLHGSPLGARPNFDSRVFQSQYQDQYWNKSWFDLDKATNLVSGSFPPDISVWVDKDRGVFYFVEIN